MRARSICVHLLKSEDGVRSTNCFDKNPHVQHVLCMRSKPIQSPIACATVPEMTQQTKQPHRFARPRQVWELGPPSVPVVSVAPLKDYCSLQARPHNMPCVPFNFLNFHFDSQEQAESWLRGVGGASVSDIANFYINPGLGCLHSSGSSRRATLKGSGIHDVCFGFVLVAKN